MPLIQVRDVPESIYRHLVEQARREHRSLPQQAITVLARGLEMEVDPKSRRQRVLESIRVDNRQGKRLSDPAKLIRDDRKR